ncbi:mitochondrial genome maintenance MGM101-domain-containing protein [Lasiosphaeria ovina]|uniref:Mitochondrial genome maintenance protein MGM101 n=1 Tax=Lasiosphaeria ovina TaxID=92902 RepID=A0AAE0NNA2_9PEZI|nr:mitochondrial genome maintenance MGM101-domain-containing protein [Lasiosphaeria ovina]
MQSRALQSGWRPLRSASSATLQCLQAPRWPAHVVARRAASSLTTDKPATSSPSRPSPAPKPTPPFVKKPAVRTVTKATSAEAPTTPTKLPVNNTGGRNYHPSSIQSKITAEAAETVSPVEDPLPTIPTPSFTGSLVGTAPLNGAATANGNESTDNGEATVDWSSSFYGLSVEPFSPEAAEILMQPIELDDVEMKPDGIMYLPEIKYRRILNKAFGPGGWGLAPRSELAVGERIVTREYALIVHGRYVAQARGENNYFSEENIPTAGEGAKSNALMRCCKDLGIGSELWDPRFIRDFKKSHCHEVWVEHVVTKKRRQIWKRKDVDPQYPYQMAPKTSVR